mgnify:CR=1 FL=1|tara:strand:+ start:109 stop:369 length:261 start_codon:yes stop_codon:yes gene_type:complete
MTKELEREGIVVSMISALPAIPLSLGAHRIIRGVRVEHLCGDPNLSEDRDWEVMYGIATTALKAMEEEVSEPTIFHPGETRAVEAV